jgi:hypothetical protein
VAGHGRPFIDVRGHVEANRAAVAERIEIVRSAIADERHTPFEIVPALMGTDDLTPMLVNWGLSEALSYLRYLERRGEVQKVDTDPERYALAPSS